MTSRALFTVERALEAGESSGLILGLDTGGPAAEIALVESGHVLADIACPAVSHGAQVADAVGSALRGAGFEFRDLKAIAVGIGPGSFTGLRIGLSYAKGIVLGTGCALIGVPSFDSLAIAAVEGDQPQSGDMICCVLDARKGEVFSALYRVGPDGVEKVLDERADALEELVGRLEAGVLLTGDGKAREASALFSKLGGEGRAVRLAQPKARGKVIAALGAAWFVRGEIDDPMILQPLYVRPAEAAFKAASPNLRSEERWRPGKNSSFASTPRTTTN